MFQTTEHQAIESRTDQITLKKNVRTFKKQEVQNPHHQYPTLIRKDKQIEEGQSVTLGPIEQVLFDHRIKQAREVTNMRGTFVLVEEIVYTLQDATLALLRRFIQVVPKQKCPTCGDKGYYQRELDDTGRVISEKCPGGDPQTGKPSPADLALIANVEQALGIPSS